VVAAALGVAACSGGNGAHTLTAKPSALAGVDSDNPGEPVDGFPPGTFIDDVVLGEGHQVSATFHGAFQHANTPNTFECRLDAAAFESCTSPQTYDGLPSGDHVFHVRAIENGAPDPTPATRAFTVSAPAANLRPVDGGPNYYAQFSYPLPSDASYFPLGVWGSYDLTQANIEKDKEAGLNLYVWPADNSIPLERFAANGMRALLTDDWYGVPGVATSNANAGYMLADEVDMTQGPNGGYETMAALNTQAPADGRARYANYGKGVMFWESDGEAQRFVNEFQQLVSNDIYWFTDPNLDSPAEGPHFLTSIGQTVVLKRAANYGYTVDRMRYLDSLDGKRKPIWNFVEVGWPFTESAAQGGRAILPAEIRAAVWHSIIAGARGIVYFNHSFGGPNTTHHVLRPPSFVKAAVESTNAQITELAPVLNSPFEDGFASASDDVRLMTKNHNGTRYIFAGSRENTASTPTFTVASGTTAVVEGEGRSIPIVNGRFSDSFRDGNAIHIYRIQ
jgi:hypothetical protein